MSGMDDSTRFSDAMRLTPVSSDGGVSVFGGMLNRHWMIGVKVNGRARGADAGRPRTRRRSAVVGESR